MKDQYTQHKWYWNWLTDKNIMSQMFQETLNKARDIYIKSLER